jgi:hypothetical protein
MSSDNALKSFDNFIEALEDLIEYRRKKYPIDENHTTELSPEDKTKHEKFQSALKKAKIGIKKYWDSYGQI